MNTQYGQKWNVGWLCILLLGVAGTADAQIQEPIASYELRVYPEGSQTPQAHPIQLSQVTCDRDLEPETLVNPTRIGWDDPDRVGRGCLADVKSFLWSLTPGRYDAELLTVSAAGASPSARTSVFTLTPVPPPAPTGLRPVQ